MTIIGRERYACSARREQGTCANATSIKAQELEESRLLAEKAVKTANREKEIKEELKKMGVDHSDAFEKEDLVQRLIDAKAFAQVDTPLTMEQAASGMDMVNNDEDGRKILEEIQSNTRLLEAAMDIAQNGMSDKYEDDEEVMNFMRRLEAISKRQA